MAERKPVKALPEETIRRIAAGEVIVRPANAVKELIENAIDAGATRVRIEIKDGGKNLIKVSDDGCGMTREDARLAIARHATSKLATVEDLERIESFGFRGEALASVAAVSRLTLETNTTDGEPGTALEVEGGDVREVRETARSRGTTVTARMLFYNLPVRRSFMKSENYEARLVAETVRSYAIAFPNVAFDYVSNERAVAKLAPAESTRERLAALFEKRLVESLVDVKVDNPTLSLRGAFADPTQCKAFYEVQAVYFNNRPVRNHTAVRAVYEGYGPTLAGNNPSFVLFVEADPAQLDVNLHPTKQEVRYKDERFLFDFIAEAVRRGLGIQRTGSAEGGDFLFQRGFGAEDATPQGFWQLHNSYIMAQVASGYVIVDQHAAHERILFEESMKGRQNAAPQGLLFPITIELGPDQFAAYERVADRLAQMGLETHAYSGRTVVVEAVPAGSYMGKDELHELFSDVDKAAASEVSVTTELAKLIACKGAVKAGQRLAQPEMESLINRLFACREPHFCPHGRPAIIKITLDDLDRRFGRQ